MPFLNLISKPRPIIQESNKIDKGIYSSQYKNIISPPQQNKTKISKQPKEKFRSTIIKMLTELGRYTENIYEK